ncbi:hypothetical protein [Laspinema olomoucense]|uniref:Uncharacterized protein n=1 Tax=Laspinema olomoucense D3b TaxID=2953688 RepID=A0ABT2NBW2_9CYAN|nr:MULTISPECIES: hypothetical protein [unclassified Laspinema]MCT7971513.1 hypothetical protein [Laspinema sp. D3d]MCT7980182.1 hypothetical protein [Laspinema sp. D3b]MCT7990963.1 hypothetical protein [Laspinema sp. D3a]MCT7995446.1 hypothetical protein [Laspinema sp. D3c]
MSVATPYSNAPDVSTEDYLVVGLATCFLKQDGEVHQVKIVEPIPSAALEAILKGIPTSYEMACATTLGTVLEGEQPKLLPDFPADAQFCDDFAERAISTVRTYQHRPQACEAIAIGSTYRELNYSVERKRVLNSDNIVRAEDNVKQHEYTHKVL